ncbi:hypothetical protein BpHYR1_010295 [Brachionus plicatilis]|uniref:Uncharacterized protein n=1 Tax=Brachionus plicatilis TaxID=10195 RepID=A0A3M7QQZ7_BRAPC|nr:hypothetical protein BpHYR1_010295 [Brachionus plicatilis]
MTICSFSKKNLWTIFVFLMIIIAIGAVIIGLIPIFLTINKTIRLAEPEKYQKGITDLRLLSSNIGTFTVNSGKSLEIIKNCNDSAVDLSEFGTSTNEYLKNLYGIGQTIEKVELIFSCMGGNKKMGINLKLASKKLMILSENAIDLIENYKNAAKFLKGTIELGMFIANEKSEITSK